MWSKNMHEIRTILYIILWIVNLQNRLFLTIRRNHIFFIVFRLISIQLQLGYFDEVKTW